MESESKGHSEEYFGDFRDFWYNQDFLELMAKRWELENVNTLLDVGCGQGHWTRTISQFLSVGAKVTAIDSEPKWAQEDEKLLKFFNQRKLSFRVKQADISELPFPDDSFDAVTCQTVLIHLKDPLEALREMKRVLKPTGILFCAEPNNLVGSVIKDSITSKFEIDEIIDWFTFGLIKEKGKINLGKGDSSVGDIISQLFSRLELSDIKVHLSDKANVIIPPYKSKEIKAMLKFRLENEHEEFMKAETTAQFKSLGDKYEGVRRRVEKMVESYKAEVREAIDDDSYFDVSTAVMYLVSGRK